MALFLNENDVAQLLDLDEAIGQVDKSLRQLSDGVAFNEPRHRMTHPDTWLNVMWAATPLERVVGFKAYPVARGPQSIGPVPTAVLHDWVTGELLAIMEAHTLGQLRTGAASAVATRALARGDASVLTIFGTGFQALGQARALARVLPALELVKVVGRNPARAQEFVARLERELQVPVEVDSAETASREADVVVTATRAKDPVVFGDWIAAGTHVNAIGSNQASNREVDAHLLRRAAVIAVDDTEAARSDCGDLTANGVGIGRAIPLGHVLTGRACGRMAAEDVTVFASQGLALWDVACAALVYSKAVEAGSGLRLPTTHTTREAGQSDAATRR